MPGATTPAVDMKAALDRMGGSAELLGRLIAEFCDKEANVAQDAADLLSARCMAEATRRVHSAKGTAMILGLDAFSAAALSVERALRQGDAAAAKDLLVPLAHELAAAVAACERERAKAAKDETRGALPADGADALLERLLARLDRNSMSALPLADELARRLRGSSHCSAADEIKRLADDLDFAAAREGATRLAQALASR